jgi:hypothetical protein
MEKQTAVKWLEKEFVKLESTIGVHGVMYELIEQAKEMEKEQIIDAFGVGCHLESKRLIGYHDVAQQYYNETYKKP